MNRIVTPLFQLLLLLSLAISLPASAAAADHPIKNERLSIFDIALKLPQVYGDTFDIATDKENLGKWAA
ncbi:MAG: hypothetical protein EOP05_12000, partial [Proteobacteria bacterium]